MKEELDAETLRRGGVHFICPICLVKKKQVEEAYLNFCCGQDICITCADSYDDECKRKSLKLTCEYCRAEVSTAKLGEEGNRLLKKRGSNHVCINMIHMKSCRHSLSTPLHAIADEGKDWAQYQLGSRYLIGSHGFDMNLPEGVRYVQMAAEKGYAPAQCELGALYVEGRGVPQDGESALHWSLLAANQGYARAQYDVGLDYYYGERVDKDIDQAFIWWKKSADLGYHMAQHNLGKHENVLMHRFDVC
jgi:TPR repeat protein